MLAYSHPWPVLIEQGKDLWDITILGLPGCQSAAETLDKALDMLNGTVEDHIAVLELFGGTVPDPPPGPSFIRVRLDPEDAEDFGPDWEDSLEHEQWIKAPRAAKLIGCSQDSVENHIKDGRLPAYHSDRDYLLRLGDVIKFICSSPIESDGFKTTETASPDLNHGHLVTPAVSVDPDQDRGGVRFVPRGPGHQRFDRLGLVAGV